MANETLTKIRLAIKAGNKTYFSSNNINPSASDAMLNDFASAVNSVQNMSLDKVIKTADYLLTQA